MRILLSNDDGIHAPGLRSLYTALSGAGHEVLAVAPLTEQSGVSSCITTHLPLRVHDVNEQGFKGHAVSGTPVDCVKFALTTLLTEPPDLVVAGINAGGNFGTDVYYSGTLGAATEGAMLGIRSIAFSRATPPVEPFEPCAAHATAFIDSLDWDALPMGVLLSVNYPRICIAETLGVRPCRMSLTPWKESYVRHEDPSARPYWWISGWTRRPTGGDDTDIAALRAGWITLTPLTTDRTNQELLATLNETLHLKRPQ